MFGGFDAGIVIKTPGLEHVSAKLMFLGVYKCGIDARKKQDTTQSQCSAHAKDMLS